MDGMPEMQEHFPAMSRMDGTPKMQEQFSASQAPGASGLGGGAIFGVYGRMR